MINKWTPDRHPDEDVFEDYVFNKLGGSDASDFEEHLLVCEQCQETLTKTDDYILLLKTATGAWPRRLRTSPPPVRWSPVAATALLLACLTTPLSWRAPPGDAKTVFLEAYRAGGASALAPAKLPLDLKIDLTDVQPAAGYRIEVVAATGRRLWFGGTPARLRKGLAPGTYWVRLSTDTGELLREYGLTVVR